MEYSIKPKRLGRKENNPLPSKEDNLIIRDGMKKYSKDEVLRQYEESGKIMYQATLDEDYKANNKEGKGLLKFLNILKFADIY